MSAIVNTKMGDIGELASGAIEEILDRATAGAAIGTYSEGASPLSWAAVATGGWDLVGVRDGDEGAELRDLVALAQVWGTRLLPLPLMESVMAKRHSSAAREWDGPVSFAVPTASLGVGSRRYIPFGQVEGLRLATSLGEGGADTLIDVPVGTPDTLDLISRGLEVTKNPTAISDAVAHELAVVYAATSVGAARRMLDLAVEFAQERRQFGKPIGSFQAVKHHLANTLIAVESADAAVLRASLTGEVFGQSAEYSVNRCLDAAELVLQVHGGLGFTWEMGLHHYLRHIMMAKDIIGGLRRRV